MFARLGALASKKPPAPSASSSAKTTSSTLPARREREEEEEENKKRETEEQKQQQENQNTSENHVDHEGENDDDDDDQPSPFRKSYADYSLQEEKDLIHELRTKIATHEEALQQYENQLHVGDESQSQSKNTTSEKSTGNNNTNSNNDQEHDEVIIKDNILFSWISLQLSRWHFELMSKKRSTDPMDMDAIDFILEKLKAFDSSNEHIQPMLVGFQSHQLPRELTDALFKVYNFVVHEKNFIEAENIYFDYLLGSANWHIGVYTMLHQRASHESFKVGNVKSKLHNHELRKMMIAFKELINLEKRRYEESKKKTA